MELKKLLGINTPVPPASSDEGVLTPLPSSVIPFKKPGQAGALIHKYIMRGMLPENVEEAKKAALINRRVPEIAEPVGMAVNALKNHVQIRSAFSGIDYDPLEKESDNFVPNEDLPNYLIREGMAALGRGDLFGFDILQDKVDGVGEVIESKSIIVSRLLESPDPEVIEAESSDGTEITLPTLVERLKEISHGGQIEINLYIVSSRAYLEEGKEEEKQAA